MFDNLARLYKQAQDDPHNMDKELAYYKALADARLDDYYRLQDEKQEYNYGLGIIADIAQRFADGHDEINEDTPDAYIKLLEGYLIRISEMAVRGRRGQFPMDGDDTQRASGAGEGERE